MKWPLSEVFTVEAYKYSLSSHCTRTNNQVLWDIHLMYAYSLYISLPSTSVVVNVTEYPCPVKQFLCAINADTAP